MSYRKLTIYKAAVEVEIKIHDLSLQLPKYEMYELGSQIRRASQSIRANIVEGHGRRIYKQEYLRFLYFSYASLLETKSHLEIINRLYPKLEINKLQSELYELGGQLYRFIQSVRKNHKTTSI